MDGYVNSQNYRMWSTENPHKYREAELHPTKVGVWCAISRPRIVGAIFFTTTITSDMYADILMQFIMLLEEDKRDSIFQQDGARPHTSKEYMAMLRRFFGDRLVSMGLCPHSRFVPLDYFLWRYQKDKIFETAVPNENVLWQRIKEEIQRIPPHTLRMVFRNFRRRAFVCKNVWGTQFQHLP